MMPEPATTTNVADVARYGRFTGAASLAACQHVHSGNVGIGDTYLLSVRSALTGVPSTHSLGNRLFLLSPRIDVIRRGFETAMRDSSKLAQVFFV